MENITNTVNNRLHACINLLYGNEFDLSLFVFHRGSKTDYQFNQLHNLAKMLSHQIEKVADNLKQALSLADIFVDVCIVQTNKQTILTVNLSTTYIEKMVNLVCNMAQNAELPKPMLSLPKKVLIDFSSPNIAKEMHVGHLRSTIIGESLCRIYEFCGSNVVRINHIGDWGTQFGMLIAYIKKFKPTSYTIGDLMLMYKESKKMFDTDTEFKSQSYLETVALQKKDPTNITIWKSICNISMQSFNKIYEQLDIYGYIRGESFYQDLMVELVEDLDYNLVTNDGMKLFFVEEFDVPLIIVKSDGGFTYDTSDLAAARYRLMEDKADQIVYVVDSGQELHFKLLFGAVDKLGWAKKSQLKHAGFGLVLGSDGKKLKTRSGEIIKLEDLLDEAYKYSKDVTKTLAKERHTEWDEEMIDCVSKKIAINCIKYADLCNPRQTNYKFSYDKMLNLKGNTGVYLMYALARCKAILRKNKNNEYNNSPIILDTLYARNLAFKLMKYPEAIADSIENLSPHYLCNYLYDLVGLVTKFYENDRCIEFNQTGEILQIHNHRIQLISLVAKVITQFFHLIGLKTIEEI